MVERVLALHVLVVRTARTGRMYGNGRVSKIYF